MAQTLLQKIEANGKSYAIKEIYPIHPDTIEQEFLKLKELRGYDALVRNDKFYFLCDEISEAIYSDVPNEPISEPVKEIVNEELKELNNLNI